MLLHVACGVVFSAFVKIDFLSLLVLQANLLEFQSEDHIIMATQPVRALISVLSSASSLSDVLELVILRFQSLQCWPHS